MMPGYAPARFSFDVRSTDTDCWDRLHLFALFSFMQEAAYLHVQNMKDAFGDFDQQGLCWLLIRVSVRLKERPGWRDAVTVETSHRGVRRLTFIRDFIFYDQTGRSFGFATSEWVVADRAQHKPQRPRPDWPQNMVDKQLLACPRLLPLPTEMKKPQLTLAPLYSDMDRNWHVNNARYVAWSLDVVKARQASDDTASLLDVRSFDIHYIKETGLGDTLNFYCEPDDTAQNDFLIETKLLSDGSSIFRARVGFSDHQSDQAL